MAMQIEITADSRDHVIVCNHLTRIARQRGLSEIMGMRGNLWACFLFQGIMGSPLSFLLVLVQEMEIARFMGRQTATVVYQSCCK